MLASKIQIFRDGGESRVKGRGARPLNLYTHYKKHVYVCVWVYVSFHVPQRARLFNGPGLRVHSHYTRVVHADAGKKRKYSECMCMFAWFDKHTKDTHTHNTHADLALGPHQKDNDTTADPISLAMLDCNIGCCFLVFHTARLRYSTTRLRYSTARLKHY